jgi:MFS family permease
MPSSRTAIALGFAGGFVVMVLEMVGMRLLARDFGSSFYVWTSQIGMVLVALSAGYVLGGLVADRWRRPRWLGLLLLIAALFTALIPQFAGGITGYLVNRHPSDQEIPLFWQKLDPAVGAALVFLPPCLILAMLPPCLIRWAATKVEHVGRISGLIYGAGSIGSIAGVFASGYLLIDLMALPTIFRSSALLIAGMALVCWIWKPVSDTDLSTHG